MKKTLEAKDQLIEDIFQGNYQFEIPEFQRPYAWTTEQAGELFDDLVAAMREARSSSKKDSDSPYLYFLGSIVLIKNGRNLKSLVVDGQQRLSTLTILFAALREAMPDAADDITDFLYKKGKVSLGEKDEYRLTVREQDADFFRTNIQKKDGIAQLVANTGDLKDSRLCYRENAMLLLEKTFKLKSDERSELWQFLAKNCSLVVISTPDLEAAYRIFSVLNNRGLDLAPIDILKAQVLGQIRSTKGQDESSGYAKKWSDIESELGRDAFGELFSHIRTIYAQQKQRATLVKEFQDFVTEYPTPTVLIDKVIQPYAEVWSFVRDASFEAIEHAETINEHLRWLNRVDFKDWVPPALVYFKRFRQKTSLLAAFFKLLERLTYFLLVTKTGVNERIDTFAALVKEIESETFDGDAATLKTLELTPQQKHEFLAVLDGDIYRNLPKARMALVLRLESLVRAPGVKLEDVVSLEHVLPQKPSKGSDWIKWFPDEKERDLWTHRLSNLVPLDRRKNSSASNYDFARKKDIYFRGKKGTASPFMLTQEVRAESEWTPTLLAKRQEELVGKLKKHWDLGGC